MREYDGSAFALVDIGHSSAVDFQELPSCERLCAIGHCFSPLEPSESFVRLFLFPPLCVKLRDRRADGKSPSKHREILEFLRHDVPVLCLFRRHARFEHLARLLGKVVKDLAHRGNTALSAKLPMPWHEQCVLVPRRKSLQRLAPPGNRRLLVIARGIPPASQ